MVATSSPPFSVAGLFAEREARRRREQDAEEQLKRKQQEEIAEFKQRLENFQLTDEHVQVVLDRIKRAFDNGETELLLTAFPSDFCTDSGRAIINADAPPINKPDKNQRTAQPQEPAWLATLPAGARPVYDFWKHNLESGGFKFSARIVTYVDGKPGDVGLFFSWPKSALDVQS